MGEIGKIMKKILDIVRRTLAVIILKVTGTFVGGTAINLSLLQSAAMAAIAGIMEVAQELSSSYLNDGKLDPDEINAKFGKIANKIKPEDDENF